MIPMYKNSPQPCQMRPQGCYHHQGYGNNLHHTKMDVPSPSCGSCAHGNFPAYNVYWPPCYHPQVPCHHCYVNFPGFHPSHASYVSPCYMHPSFPVGYQQPWYDSQKDVPGKHDCGKCSPQICYPNNNRGVVIEEHEPEIEKENKGEAVFPVGSTNYPYPIIWIPHDNARNQEHGISRWSGNNEQPPAEVKAPEKIMVQKNVPKSWNGYFPFDERTIKSLVQSQDRENAQNGEIVELPFDISKLISLLQGQDMKEAQIQKNKEEPEQLPYPISWIPSHGKQEDVEASESEKYCNVAHNLKSLASGLHGNESQKIQKEGKEGNIDCNVLSDAKVKSSMRNIPVESHLQEPRNVPVKLLEGQLPKPMELTKKTVKNEPVDKKKKEHSSSPKVSRLPPVCLRVDPLPKKRNDGSKTLSPTRRKDHSLKSEETKGASPLHSKKAESKTVPDVCNVICEEANKEVKMPEGCLNAVETENTLSYSCSNLQEGSNCETVRPCETKEKSEEPAKKTFTEEEAAKIIQSRYRGYDVRRWETLKKLKEIATVRDEMGNVQKRIKAMEVSTDQHIEEKEILVVGEMVMNLLLKLDSVQGLHPSIRDHRKSLARKLSDIEEKLDSLKKNNTVSAITEEEAVKEQANFTSLTRKNLVNVEHSHLAEENSMVSDSNTGKDLPRSPEEHPMSVVNRTDEIGQVNILKPNDPPSVDGTGMAMTNCGEDKAALESLEEPLHELPQLEQMTQTQGLGLNATEVFKAEANTSENEDGKGDNDPLLVSEKDVELSELPVGVLDDETQPLSQGPLSCTCEAIVAAMDPVTMSQEKTDVDIYCDNFKGVGKEIYEPQEEQPLESLETEASIVNEQRVETKVIVNEQAPDKEAIVNEKPLETKVTVKELPLETEAIVKELPLETEAIEKELPLETEVIVKEQPPEREVTEHELSEQTKKLMEENQRYKETMETLVKAGREQLEVISKLTGRVKSLEKKLSQKKKRTRIGHRKPSRATKPMVSSLTETVM